MNHAPDNAKDATNAAHLTDVQFDALAAMLRTHEMIHGDAIAQEQERRRLERFAVPNNRHERRKHSAINRRGGQG